MCSLLHERWEDFASYAPGTATYAIMLVMAFGLVEFWVRRKAEAPEGTTK